MNEIVFENKPESVTASNYREHNYKIKDSIVKKSISGRMQVVVIEESGREIWINNKSLVKIVKAYGIKRAGWVGHSIYPFELVDTTKGKSINWMPVKEK